MSDNASSGNDLGNILEWHKQAMDYIGRSAQNHTQDVALMSCFVNGEPTAAIVAVCEDGLGEIELRPMFVAITPGMKLTDDNGISPVSREEMENVVRKLVKQAQPEGGESNDNDSDRT